MRGDRLDGVSGGLRIGSEDHKALFCRTFIETHDPFEPGEIVWPDLDEQSLARLKSLPVWDEAVRTESATALRVQTLGRAEKDPLLAEAIALQGYEEGRHAEILRSLTAHYGIPCRPTTPPLLPRTPSGLSSRRDTESASTPSSPSASSPSARARSSSRRS